MNTPSIPLTEPAAQAPKVDRRPLGELLPAGAARVLVVAASATLVAASFARFGLDGRAFVGAVLCPTLVLLTAIDIEHRLLPNLIILPAALAVGLIVAVSAPGDFLAHFAWGAGLGGFFFLFALLAPGSIGMGDVKLGFLLGLALGSETLGAALIAVGGLLVAALYVLARRGLSARKEAIPFGPFLALGGILAFFLG